MDNNDLKVSIIIPCFNEEKVIAETYKRVISVVNQLSIIGYEIIFINDGSKDNTYFILKEIATKNLSVKVINLSRNFGHQPAVTAGITACNGDIAVILDADLQDPPELIPAMIEKYLVENANVVYAQRISRGGESFFKKLSSKFFYRLLNYLSDIQLPVDTGDFRLIDRQVIEAFKNLPEKNKYIRGLITWVGFKQVPILYNRDERFAGDTKYPFHKMLSLATNSMLYFSKKPLKMAMTIGFLSLFVGLFLAVYVIFGLFFKPETIVKGWASSLITIIFFGGVQLVTIGVLGEYLANVFDEIKNRPEYIVHEKINF